MPKPKLERILVITNLISTEHKIIGAQKLMAIIISHGLSKEHAQFIANHEKSHALADPGPGSYGILKDKQGRFMGAFYRYHGRRSSEILMQIAVAGEALGTPWGQTDTKKYNAAKRRLAQKILNQAARVK